MTQSDYQNAEMWIVVAIIQGFRLDAVMLALEKIPEFAGVTVSDCRGFGSAKLARQRHDSNTGEHPATHSDPAAVVDFNPKVKLEMVLQGEAAVTDVMETISLTARTGRAGDGKVFAWSIDRALRIRTGETGPSAL